MKSRFIHIAAFAAFLLLATSAFPAAVSADLVFVNGKVFTADSRDAVVQGFAVKDGRFIAVGASRAMRAYIGPDTQVIDLAGRFVSPGLADGHLHSEGGGPGVDLSHARSLGELMTLVADAVHAAPADAVIVSNSDWHEAQLKEQRLPLATELDQAVSDHPVVLVRGGHSYILNSAALAKWNINRETPVPAGGAISRDAKGELTGELFDTAKALVALPPPPPVTMADLMATQRALNRYGITAVRIPGSYKGSLMQAYELMKTADANHQLTLRYIVYLPGFTLKSAAEARELIARWNVAQDAGDEWVRIGGVKLLVDGGFEGGHMSAPYAEPYGHGGTFSGVTVVQHQAYTEVVTELNRMGWRVATHAVGDAALDQVLNAYQAADAEHSIAGKRWTVEHAFVVTPGQLKRLKKLDIAVSAQDHLYLAAPVLKKYWGAKRAAEVTPMKDFIQAGLLVASGTDSPVIPFNPFWTMYHFASRDTISDGVYGPDQKIASRSVLLKLATINYAKLIGEAADKGSIEPGKLADFAILTDDFLTVPLPRMRDMEAIATYVGGKEVYRAAGYVPRIDGQSVK